MATDMDCTDIEVGNVAEKVDADPPPTYTTQNPTVAPSTTPPGYNDEPPPSYESVFGRVRQMRDESSSNAEFTKKLFGCVLCGSMCSIIMVVIMLAIPIACLVFGAIYIDDCPFEKYIPIYLLVTGVFGIFKAILGIIQMILKKKSSSDSDEDESAKSVKIIRLVDGPISCFLSAWFIAGSVWVYRTYGKYSDDPSASDYCNSTLYLFAFWILTVQYIMIALAIFCCCLGIIVACCLAGKQS